MSLQQVYFGTTVMRADYQLGERIVRPQRDCIERGHETVHVKPKSMAVLEQLAGAPGQTVTRHEIFDAVWPGGAVTDDVLTQCIVELRKALGDSARHPGYIETIPKVGFRLLREVTSLEPAGETTLAVLPFVDISEEQDQGWYAYGLTEELINRLANLEGLQVSSRTASYNFEDSDKDPKSIAMALDVRYLLEGSVRTDFGNMRITAQLIDTQDGFHAWSKQFDRPREDIFTVQEEIAGEVAAALEEYFRKYGWNDFCRPLGADDFQRG